MEYRRIDNPEDLEKIAEMFTDGAKKAVRCMVNMLLVIMLQLRKERNSETIKKYAEAQKNGDTLPPIRGNVDLDAREIYCYDGDHRLEAAKINGQTHIVMDLTPGTKRDAILNAAGVNEEHCLARSKADKRNSVEAVLADPEWCCRSSSWIAQVTHTSVPYVEELRKKTDKAKQAQGNENTLPIKRKVKRGNKEYEMTIPVKPAKDPVEVIMGKVNKMAQTLEDTDRSRLARALIEKFGGDAA